MTEHHTHTDTLYELSLIEFKTFQRNSEMCLICHSILPPTWLCTDTSKIKQG